MALNSSDAIRDLASHIFYIAKDMTCKIPVLAALALRRSTLERPALASAVRAANSIVRPSELTPASLGSVCYVTDRHFCTGGVEDSNSNGEFQYEFSSSF